MPSPPDPARVGLWAQLACIWEATARKAGNVHRERDFADLTYLDFLHSAAAIGPAFAGAAERPVGATILDAIRATRTVVASNTNLGIVLLLAPLAAVPLSEELRPGLTRVLNGLDLDDTRNVYTAIRLAAPGGLGAVPAEDIADEPTRPLRDVMALARAYDLIARQYADGFQAVLEAGVPALRDWLDASLGLEDAIVATHLHLLATQGDTLIARKRGVAVAAEASRRAAAVLAAGWPKSAAHDAFAELDAWLRADGNGRNPGACADLVAACLFVALREGVIALPIRWSN